MDVANKSPGMGLLCFGSNAKGIFKNQDFWSLARRGRTDDCMDAEGRTTPGAVVEKRSVHAST
jgi:hypothetical protein